jgi:hypothetical protein
MSKKMSALELRVEPGTLQGNADYGTNARIAKRTHWRRQSGKDLAGGTNGTAVAYIDGQRFAEILRQWQTLNTCSFSMNDDLSTLPIQIVQHERTDLAGTQAKSGQQHENRVITLADPGRTVATLQ